MAAVYLGRSHRFPHPPGCGLAPASRYPRSHGTARRETHRHLECLRQRTQTTQQSLDARPGEALYWAIAKHGAIAMLWFLSHIRREKTRQIQRCPHAIVRRDIWLCSAQTKRDLSAPMGLEQIKQDRKAVEIPPGNYPTQAIRILIQIGAHRRRAVSVQKPITRAGLEQ